MLFFVFGAAAVHAQTPDDERKASSAHTHEISTFWAARFADFFKDPAFPLDTADAGFLSYYNPDSNFRVTAEVEVLFGEQPFQMPTYAGTTSEYVRYGIATFRIGEESVVQLTLYRSTRLFADPKYKDHLFVPFIDETNGEETYGGGRYLDLSIQDIKNGLLEIDFNRAYNPLCAYSGGYRCPIPPPDNHLSVKILAGERNYTGPIKERPAAL